MTDEQYKRVSERENRRARISQSARDAEQSGYRESYCDYLDQHAEELHDYFMRHGDPDTAAQMLTRSLSESLMGNDGD